MPDYATLHCRLTCCHCGESFDNALDFQWGALPEEYELGDEIRWVSLGGELLPPFTIHPDERRWNAGDPCVGSLWALDARHLAPEILGDGVACRSCGGIVVAAAVEVLEGRIARAMTLSRESLSELLDGACPGSVDAFELREDGVLLPRPDLSNPIVRVLGRGELELERAKAARSQEKPARSPSVTTKPTGKKSTGKKATGKKSTGKKSTGKKPTGRGPAGKEPTGRRLTGRKPARKELAGREPADREPAGRKPGGGKTKKIKNSKSKSPKR